MARECDLFLDEHEAGKACSDPAHGAALARRADTGTPWSQIERGNDGGGQRDFLDGRPIHCGTTLELQTVEVRSDDYGDYSVVLPSGVRVRYELDVPRPEEERRRIVLHSSVGGYEFTRRHSTTMRFRWPRRDA